MTTDHEGATGRPWPELAYEDWADTCTTLHLWTQIVGKVRLACTPWVNHSWHVVLYPTSRGLTTSPIPWRRGTFEIELDFHDHALRVSTSWGTGASLELRPRSVADFHATLLERLRALGIDVQIHDSPSELEDPIPFARDEVHGSYDAEYAHRYFLALDHSARVMSDFRGEFIGKSSPVHFFWGAPDLAVTRFSGRRAPEHPGGVPGLPDWVGREAYSHEVSSAGFWPGGPAFRQAIYYAYAYPTPDGYADARVEPGAAGWSDEMSEFVLPYEAVRTAADPDAALLAFLRSTYVAAAETGGWDREALEWGPEGRPPWRPGG